MRKRKKKRYIACNVPKTGEKDFDSVVRRLKEEAGRARRKSFGGSSGMRRKKTTETGGDKGCPAFPDGGEVGAEIG